MRQRVGVGAKKVGECFALDQCVYGVEFGECFALDQRS